MRRAHPQFEYLLTDKHIVVQRGQLRRSIERRSISYARIHWNPKHPGIGDLDGRTRTRHPLSRQAPCAEHALKAIGRAREVRPSRFTAARAAVVEQAIRTLSRRILGVNRSCRM